ncbi:putative ATPase/DNA-binding SARP family transcriptional activator [Streptomyces griseochromogenes]|uniref:ATPase n=1 Tax=Streptomyces griseochromogenes TaxID=68214 RepID=A0A1B1AYI8_9ACTN|nr:BTAD domain-containing putative transcriptional regulator [Streptomyces griseochromogenes]ANP51601.1 ATPase [Streptomyces griseochromogenes]MBP2054301.1 putative ATPase/DNA-binding SARP family transcriptional activator [Streptomyces griseochromogenes]
MRFGILGETQMWGDDGTPVPLGGPARRALLTLLLIRPGEAVPADRLAEGAGPDGAPSAHALQSQVSRLRTALAGAAVIERTGAGYRLLADTDDVDAGRFERLAAEGRVALREGDAERAVTALRAALQLWRGPALADLADVEQGGAPAVRLEELRLTALEHRIEAELLLGEHRALVPELRELVGRHPLRERVAALLIRALFADGGHAEALLVYEQVRRHLAEELGTDPSAELGALHRELLAADSVPVPAAPPAPLTAFVGRSGEVADVTGLLRVARLVTLTGPGGVGKTRLAAEITAAADDEVCFVELGPLRDPRVLPQTLLGALGLRERGLHAGDAGGQGALDRLTAALSGRTLLLVLDNCEHLVEEAAVLAARLLTTSPGLRVLATSREPLGVIGEHLHTVRPLDDAAAAELFTDRARAVRRAFVPDPEAVRRVCAALDNLPLAIELAAARLRTLSLGELADRLHDRLGVAARGSRAADIRHRTLRSVVAWSWDLLDVREQQAARRFSVFAAGATTDTACQVCGTDEDTLAALADKSLLERSAGRYRMLSTIRAYAAERLDEAGEESGTNASHTRAVLEILRRTEPLLRDRHQLLWMEALSAEQAELLAAVRRAVGAGEWRTALELLGAASTYLWIRGAADTFAVQADAVLDTLGDDVPDGLGEEYALCVLLAASGPNGRQAWRRHRKTAERALTAAWSGTDPGRWPAGLLPWMMHQASDGDARAAHALVSAQRDRPDPWTRAAAHYVAAYGPLGDGDLTAAEQGFRTAAAGFRALGERWGAALVLDGLAGLAGERGAHAEAAALIDDALGLAEELGALEDCADLLVNRGDLRAAADPEAAGCDYARAAEYACRAGSERALAAARRGLADIALLDGDTATARELYTRALERLDPHWVKGVGNRVRTLAGLAGIALADGDPAGARALYREAARSAVLPGHELPESLRLLGLPDAMVEAVSKH